MPKGRWEWEWKSRGASVGEGRRFANPAIYGAGSLMSLNYIYYSDGGYEFKNYFQVNERLYLIYSLNTAYCKK